MQVALRHGSSLTLPRTQVALQHGQRFRNFATRFLPLSRNVPWRGIETMFEETLHRRGTTLVRRLRLAPGESTPWHRDPFHRVTVVLSGNALAVEYRDGEPSERFALAAGQTDWDEPTDRIHRGVNVGTQPYDEITIFFLDRPDAAPQPSES